MIGELGEIDAAEPGPLIALVVESMVKSDAVVNGPRALMSTETLAVRPSPLLSDAEATAWFEIMMTTLPSVFRIGSTSISELSSDRLEIHFTHGITPNLPSL